MTNPLAQDLGGVVRLLEKATPGPWAAEQYSEDDEGCGVIAVNPEIGMRSPTRGQVAWFTTIAGASFESPGRAQANADLVAAMMNFFVTHSAEIAGALRDAERYRWLREHFRFANDSMHEIWFDDTLEPDDSGVPTDLDTAIDSAMQQGGGGE